MAGLRAASRLGRSVGSPRVVDHEAPGTVALTTQDIRVPCRQPHRFVVWSRAVERPDADHEGEVVDLGKYVLVLARITGRGAASGVPIDQPVAVLVAFEGEKAIWAKSFLSKNDALEAAGRLS